MGRISPVADDSPILDGDKGIAEFVGRRVRWVRDQRATYPDPLPAKRFRGGLIWAHRSRVALWLLRHAKKKAGPSDLVIVCSIPSIARVVGRSVDACNRLLPWASKPVRDPIPAWRTSAGRVRAYRDALVDWLDRQSAPSASPRFRRRCGKQEK